MKLFVCTSTHEFHKKDMLALLRVLLNGLLTRDTFIDCVNLVNLLILSTDIGKLNFQFNAPAFIFYPFATEIPYINIFGSVKYYNCEVLPRTKVLRSKHQNCILE